MTPLIPRLSNSSFSDSSISSVVDMKAMTQTPPTPTSLRSSLRCQSDPAFPTAAGLENQQEPVWNKPRRRISFNERVSVREYDGNSWVSAMEMEQLSPASSSKRVVAIPHVIAFPNDAEDSTTISATTTGSMSTSLHLMLQQEVRNILMVDPHDIFMTLFSKKWKQALPHVHIVTAHSSEEALHLFYQQKQQQRRAFDVVIAEERLTLFHRRGRSGNKLMSGSALISHLKKQDTADPCLLVGVSAHWQTDHATMVQSGADFCWSKAPLPTLSQTLLEEMLHRLLMKRGQHERARDLMVATASGGTHDNHHEANQPQQKQ
ncbi:expressed unknown protein [Seminavis robusta]|uniref:Uncharacterized protein n=1 Tax=Seminavis robusta TaxID=568900 RepID=A0A9N8EKI5_9STRA|nr:expressed unknown protein [Seminavis robusta]|eukprot:Sro1360_g266060.1 n/a (319) ;mRNA; f:9068-10024